MSQSDLTEIWRPVVGWETEYSISNFGRVRRDKRGPGARCGRILKPYQMPNGYLTMTLNANRRREHPYLHQLVAFAFLGPRPLGLQVNHIDGDKTNNRRENLEYVTRSYNIKDMRARLGIIAPRGEASPSAILTEADVVSIRARYVPRKVTHRMLADEFGVSGGHIGAILARKKWRYM